MNVVRSRMAYRIARDPRISPYQAQYIWHATHRRRTTVPSKSSIAVPAVRALQLVAGACLTVAAVVVLAMLIVLTYVAVQLMLIIWG